MQLHKRNSPTFRDAAQRVISGQSTKEVEAEALNMKPGTFAVWMTRSKLTSRFNPDGTPKLQGAALGWATSDSDKAKALAEATTRVLAGELTATQACRDNPILADSRANLADRVRRAKARAA